MRRFSGRKSPKKQARKINPSTEQSQRQQVSKPIFMVSVKVNGVEVNSRIFDNYASADRFAKSEANRRLLGMIRPFKDNDASGVTYYGYSGDNGSTTIWRMKD